MTNRIFTLLILLIPFIGCKQVNDPSGQVTDSAEYYTGSEIQNQLVELYHRFPSPGEMLKTINLEDIIYKSGSTNDVDKYNQYLDSKSQALNLGVYAADLAYLTVAEQHIEAGRYLEAVYALSDKLRVSAAFDRAYIIRMQRNITNSDSLKIISEETFLRLTNYLESTRNEKTFALISIGGYIEAMYLSLEISGDYNESNHIVKRIPDQKYVLQNLIKYSEHLVDQPAVAESIELLRPILEIYDQLEVRSEETKVSNDSSTGILTLKGGDVYILKEEDYKQLQKVVKEVREAIIFI